MNPERLQLKGMLAESKKQYGELKTQASGYVLIIRSLLNPYEDVSKLDTEKALSSMKLLYDVQAELKEVNVIIIDVKKCIFIIKLTVSCNLRFFKEMSFQFF